MVEPSQATTEKFLGSGGCDHPQDDEERLTKDPQSKGVSSMESKSDEETPATSCLAQNKHTTQENFPSQFYCPLGKRILQDPVVGSDGISYERSARIQTTPEQSMEEQNPSATASLDATLPNKEESVSEPIMYSNRALQEIILATLAAQPNQASRTTANATTPSRFETTSWWGAGTTETNSQKSQSQPQSQPLHNGYLCPITFEIMFEPVIDPDGYTYEKVAVEDWIRTHGTSPVTRGPLSSEDLFPNATLGALIHHEANKSPECIHPAFERWKTEEPPKASSTPTSEDYNEATRQRLESLRDRNLQESANSNFNFRQERLAQQYSVLHWFGVFVCFFCIVGLFIFGRSAFLLLLMMTLILLVARRRA